jgi:glycine cleavage system H protein
MSFNTPPDLKYAKSHEWARAEGDELVIGISDYAQDALGDVVFIELPAVGDRFEAGAIFGVIESVKAASDLYLPVAGEIVAVNEPLLDDQSPINTDPYGGGWMLRVRPDDPSLAGLLDAAAYEQFVDSIRH